MFDLASEYRLRPEFTRQNEVDLKQVLFATSRRFDIISNHSED